jgi:predicted glycosyl hydrolase (DUF1957 family)
MVKVALQILALLEKVRVVEQRCHHCSMLVAAVVAQVVPLVQQVIQAQVQEQMEFYLQHLESMPTTLLVVAAALENL